MGDATAFLKIYNTAGTKAVPEVNRQEVMRYAGIIRNAHSDSMDNEVIDNMLEVMEQCIEEALPVLTYKVSYRTDELLWIDDRPVLPFSIGDSKGICSNLSGCDEVVCFAATIGIGIDRLITKYSHISPSRALFMQAIGAERIEALCDLFNEEISKSAGEKGKITARRYSPGYGDLSLETQRELIVLLDCSRRIGVTLNDSLLMSPSKSVTAIIGIAPKNDECSKQNIDNNVKCATCSKVDCEYRKII